MYARELCQIFLESLHIFICRDKEQGLITLDEIRLIVHSRYIGEYIWCNRSAFDAREDS